MARRLKWLNPRFRQHNKSIDISVKDRLIDVFNDYQCQCSKDDIDDFLELLKKHNLTIR